LHLRQINDVERFVGLSINWHYKQFRILEQLIQVPVNTENDSPSSQAKHEPWYKVLPSGQERQKTPWLSLEFTQQCWHPYEIQDIHLLPLPSVFNK